jgi:hypothetical protein
MTCIAAVPRLGLMRSGPRKICQEVPFQCRYTSLEFEPGVPSTHTLLGAIAVTDVTVYGRADFSRFRASVGCSDHDLPFQCSMSGAGGRGPTDAKLPTAQTSPDAVAATLVR